MWGHVGIAISHGLIGVFIITGFDIGILIMICVFIWVFANTTGPLSWVYCAETCTDIGIGVCLFTLWAVVLIEILTIPILMNTHLETSGVFLMFAACNFIGAIFIQIWLKETKGLTDKEKRSLYAPKDTRDSVGKTEQSSTELMDLTPD